MSTYNLLICFSTKNEIEEMREDQQLARQCLMIQYKQLKNEFSLDQLDQRKSKRHGELAEKTIYVPLVKEGLTKIV